MLFRALVILLPSVNNSFGVVFESQLMKVFLMLEDTANITLGYCSNETESKVITLQVIK